MGVANHNVIERKQPIGITCDQSGILKLDIPAWVGGNRSGVEGNRRATSVIEHNGRALKNYKRNLCDLLCGEPETRLAARGIRAEGAGSAKRRIVRKTGLMPLFPSLLVDIVGLIRVPVAFRDVPGITGIVSAAIASIGPSLLKVSGPDGMLPRNRALLMLHAPKSRTQTKPSPLNKRCCAMLDLLIVGYAGVVTGDPCTLLLAGASSE